MFFKLNSVPFNSKFFGLAWHKDRKLSVPALLVLSTLFVTIVQAAEAPNPVTEIILEVAQDGSDPFNKFKPPLFGPWDDDAVDGVGGHTPGLDAPNLDNADPAITNIPAELNGVVRTFDTIRYNIHWNVNDVDSSVSNDGLDGIATNVVIKLSTGREDVSWTGIPARCKTSGVIPVSSIVDMGATGDLLTCNLGDVAEGTAGTISLIADVGLRADGAPSDGGLIPVSATIETDDSAEVTSNEVTTTISGTPSGGWVKSPAEYIAGVFNEGEEGGLFIYPLSFRPVDSIFGTLRGTDSFDDTKAIQFFDHAWDLTPSAIFATPAMALAVGRDICGGYDGAGSLPYGDDGSLPASAADGIDNETNSFTISCTFDAAASALTGYPVVQVDISNQDTSSSPSNHADANINLDKLVITAQVAFWAPLNELQAKFDLGEGNNLIWNTITELNTLDTTLDGGNNFVLNTDFIQIGTSSGFIDEVAIENNSVNQAVDPVFGPVPPGGSFAYRHTGRFFPGPYQEMFFPHDDGLERMGIDNRSTDLGGLGPTIDGDFVGPSPNQNYGWHGTGEVSRNEIVTLHARVVGSEDVGQGINDPIHLCTAIDNSHIEIIDFPSFQRFETDFPAFLGHTGVGAESVSSNTGSANNGIAHVLVGDVAGNLGSVGAIETASNPWTRINPLTTPDYVVQVTNNATAAPYGQHGLGCDDADAGPLGWVDTDDTAGLATFITGTDTDGNQVYGSISRIRVLMLEPRPWDIGTPMGPFSANEFGVGTSTIILNMQARVKPAIVDAPDDAKIRIHTARGRGDINIANVVVPSANCTNDTLFSTIDTMVVDASWCSLPYDPANEAAAPNDLQIDARAVEKAFLSSLNTIHASHSDRLVVVAADLVITKSNISGPTDQILNGDLVTFRIETNIIGSTEELIGNLFVDDRIDLNPNFEFVSQTAPVDAGGAALTNVTCTDAFAGVQDHLRCNFTNGAFNAGDSDTYRASPFFATWTITVRAISAPSDFAIPNEATINGDLDQPGFEPLSLTQSAFAFAYTGPSYKELVVRKDVPDMEGICTNGIGADELSDSTLIAGDCSVFSTNGQYIFDLTYSNTGSADLTEVVIIDAFPQVADDAEASPGDGRTPASDFSGTSELVSITAPGAGIECTTDPVAGINRDDDLDGSVWTNTCDATSTGFRVTMPALAMGTSETIQLIMQTNGNVPADIYTNSFGARVNEIALAVRSNDVSAMVEGVSIGSIIWSDINSDGLQTLGEPGIEGAVVKLLNGDGSEYDSDPSTPLVIDIVTTTTTSSGLYFFDGLPEGDYKIEVTMPPGYTPTINQQAGDNNEVANDSNIASSVALVHTSGLFTLEIDGEPDATVENSPIAGSDSADDLSGENSGNMTVDFGFIPPVSLGSTVFFDNNNNGLQDGTETGIEGVTVKLFASDGVTEILVGPDGILGTGDDAAGGMLTNSEGDYLFLGLSEGGYIVKVTAPASAPLSSTDIGSSTGDNDTDGDDNGIQLASGDEAVSPVIELTIGGEPINGAGGTDEKDAGANTTGDNQDDGADSNGNMTVDFGFVPTVSLGSTVFLDSDNNGIQDGTESGISGVTVKLFASDGTTEIAVGPDGILGTADDAVGGVTTNGAGDYLFSKLLEGSYIVKVTAPTGAPTSSTDIGSSTGDNDTDGDDNGIQLASGDEAVSPVIVLTVGGEPINGAGGTDEKDAGANTTGDNQDDGADSNGNMTVDFGFVPPVSLGSTVFLDSNNNGLQDGTEAGIAGVTVKLFASDGTTEIAVGPDGILGTADDAIGGVTTNGAGDYLFSNLQEGSYIVKVTAPTGAPTSSTDIGTTTGDNDVDGDDNGTQVASGDEAVSPVIVLTVGGEPINGAGGTDEKDAGANTTGDNQDDGADSNGNMTVDFGFIPSVSLGSTVFFDADNNGRQDGADVGISGVTVKLFASDGTTEIPVGPDGKLGTADDALGGMQTNGAGDYFFSGLIPGGYIVKVTPPVASPLSSTDITSSAGDNDIDGDDNGIQAASGDEVVSPLIVLTVGGEPVNGTGTTNEKDTGTNTTGDNQDDLNGSDANGNMTVDFGFIAQLSLGSTVFFDDNDNGVQEGAETGIPGVIVKLYTSNGSSEIPVGPDGVLGTADDEIGGVLTNGAGDYLFSNLPAGSYIVKASAPLSAPVSSTDIGTTTGDNDVDGDDNGVQVTAGGDAVSPIIVLSVGTEPVNGAGVNNEKDTGTNSSGDNQDDEFDANGNMTVDFGFIPSVSVSLGSTVFLDANDNGQQEGTEAGIAGVTVKLFASDGTTEIPVGPDGVLGSADDALGGMQTNGAGDYLFSGLIPGGYIVKVTPPESAPLSSTDIDSTTGDNDIDGDDNGFQVASGDEVVSPLIELTVGGEPMNGSGATDEKDTGGNSSGDNQDDSADANGNMTVDFGFVLVDPLSLGSTVFYDINNNAIQEGAEQGIPGVIVKLFESDGITEINVGPDGILGTSDDAAGGVVTDGAGDYLFTNLQPGSYIVKVVAPTSAPLSSTDIGSSSEDNNVDGDDNGVQAASGNDAVSPIIVLEAGTEPINGTGGTDEQDAGANTTGDNQDDTADANGNMTVDFGFVPSLSIGSVVWEDSNSNGLQDPDEPSLSGAVVTLLVNDGAGNFIPAVDINGNVIKPQTTSADGLYFFNNLPEGQYKVQVAAPEGYEPSPVQELNANGNAENDSNIAAETTVAGTYESGVVVLTAGDEPTESGVYKGDSQDDAVDSNGNMTIDFGFVKTGDPIVPPVTPGKPIPTLGEWARILLAMMLALIVIGQNRRLKLKLR